MPAPARDQQTLDALVAGFMQELSRLPGRPRLVHAAIRDHGATSIFEMTAEVSDGTRDMSNTQWVLYGDGTAYKLMAAGIDVDTQTDADVQRFFQSLRANVPPLPQRTGRSPSAMLFVAAFWGGFVILAVSAVLMARIAGGVPIARSSAVIVLLLAALSLVVAVRIAHQASNVSEFIGQCLPTLLLAILGIWLWNRPSRQRPRNQRAVPSSGTVDAGSAVLDVDDVEEQP
jgi:hypothetical protein